jgi:hypothetical protein
MPNIPGIDSWLYRRQVTVKDPRDVLFWCNELQCNEGQLKAAVDEVGPDAADVALACRGITRGYF